jgi:hypothetical protein
MARVYYAEFEKVVLWAFTKAGSRRNFERFFTAGPVKNCFFEQKRPSGF